MINFSKNGKLSKKEYAELIKMIQVTNYVNENLNLDSNGVNKFMTLYNEYFSEELIKVQNQFGKGWLVPSDTPYGFHTFESYTHMIAQITLYKNLIERVAKELNVDLTYTVNGYGYLGKEGIPICSKTVVNVVIPYVFWYDKSKDLFYQLTYDPNKYANLLLRQSVKVIGDHGGKIFETPEECVSYMHKMSKKYQQDIIDDITKKYSQEMKEKKYENILRRIEKMKETLCKKLECEFAEKNKNKLHAEEIIKELDKNYNEVLEILDNNEETDIIVYDNKMRLCNSK